MTSKSLQEQIANFYKETGYYLGIKDGKPYYLGSLDLYSTDVTSLPDNLVVGGWLDLSYTKISKLPDNLVVGGFLNLTGTNITELPEGLVVGGFLDLFDTMITELPENLVVGGYLDLRHTRITELPDNLIVGGCLDLEGTKIKKLPNNFVVGGSLDLKNTEVTELPDNLVVGGELYLRESEVVELPDTLVVGGYIFGISNTQIISNLTKEARDKARRIGDVLQWEQGNKTYIKADNIFSIVDYHKGNVWVTHRIGTNETLYVVTDGEGHYAHGRTLKQAKVDLIYKINDRDTSLYENLSLDDEISFEEAIVMYRTITGACSAGTRNFIESRLPQPHKEKYTIKEIIDLTDGEYGSETFKNFFDKKK